MTVSISFDYLKLIDTFCYIQQVIEYENTSIVPCLLTCFIQYKRMRLIVMIRQKIKTSNLYIERNRIILRTI